MPRYAWAHALALALASLLAPGAGCRRAAPGGLHGGDAGARDEQAYCFREASGCMACVGADPAPRDDVLRPLVCDPVAPKTCVEFCSDFTPRCALPWSRAERDCVFPSALSFRRALYQRDARARHAAVPLTGAVTDNTGAPIPDALVQLWFERDSIVTLLEDLHTGGQGGFRVVLWDGPWRYFLRFGHPGYATEVVGLPALERARPPAGAPTPTPAPLAIHLPPAETLRGHVIDGATGAAIAGATVQAMRGPEDPLDLAQAITDADGGFAFTALARGTYVLWATKFGWRPLLAPVAASAPGAGVRVALVAASVVNGIVLEADGLPAAGATVAASLSGPSGGAPAIFWTAEADGTFAEDDFAPGTYYVWARRHDRYVFPPERVEVAAPGHPVSVRLVLGHRGARVSGRMTATRPGTKLPPTIRVTLVSRSPLAYPGPLVARPDAEGRFTFVGLLPGRYDLGARAGDRVLPVVSGPRDVEVPIEAGSAMSLSSAVVVLAPSE